jgi:uncharacterized membrane protein
MQTSKTLGKGIDLPKAKLLQWLPIVTVLLFATVLRLYQLNTESLWIDEMLSIRAAEKFDWISGWFGPRPLYMGLLKIWMGLGTGDVWLRSLAVLFGIGTVFVIYRLGTQVANESVGLIAAFMASISPIFINHSQEVRMYSLVTLLSAAGTLAMVNWLTKPRFGVLSAWAVLRLLAILAFPLCVTLLVPDTLLFVIRFYKNKRWLLAGFGGLVFIILFWTPAALSLFTAVGEFGDDWVSTMSKPDLMNIIVRLTNFTVLWPSYAMDSNSEVFTGSLFVKIFYGLFTLLLVAILAVGMWVMRRSIYILWLAAWTFLPAGAILAKTYIGSHYWIERYLLFVAPTTLVLLAIGFMNIWISKRKLALVIAFIYGIAVSGGLGFYYSTLFREDWRGAANYVELYEQPGDVIGLIARIPRPDLGFSRYYDGSNSVYFADNIGDVPDITRNEVEEQLQGWPEVDSRLWVVCFQCRNQEAVEWSLQTVVGKDFEVMQQKRIFQGIFFDATIDVILVQANSELIPE